MGAINPHSSDSRVKAIRSCPEVGTGSCSVADECYSDMELAIALNEAGVTTKAGAVKWAREQNDTHWGQCMEVRSEEW